MLKIIGFSCVELGEVQQISTDFFSLWGVKTIRKHDLLVGDVSSGCEIQIEL